MRAATLAHVPARARHRTADALSAERPIARGAVPRHHEGMSDLSRNPIRRLQVVGVAVVGVVAGIAFVLSLVLEPELAGVFRVIAMVAAFVCALIGVSFAFTEKRR